MALVLLGTACGEKDGMGSVSGVIAVSERDLSADVEWDAAFAYAEGDRLIAFLTGAPGASCETVADYLGPNTGALDRRILEGSGAP